MLEILQFFGESSQRVMGLIAVIFAICFGASWIIGAWRSDN
jgi:hypothetical protein